MYSRFLGDRLEFPFDVTTNNDQKYTIANEAAFNQFCDLAVYAVGMQIEVGRNLKVLVKAAATEAELNAIVDERA